MRQKSLIEFAAQATMAIRRKEVQIPDDFPPAELYLDDIQEIIEIFRESTKYKRWEKNTDSEQLVFECDDKICETSQDLQSIGGKTRNFAIKISLQGVNHRLAVRMIQTLWSSTGLTKEGDWDTYRKLVTVFKSRCVKWKAAFHSIPIWVSALSGLLLWPLLFILKRLMPANLAAVLTVSILLLFWVFWSIAYFRPTIVFLRPSSESSGFRELIKKSAPQIIAALIGVGATLLGVYLRHKLWP